MRIIIDIDGNEIQPAYRAPVKALVQSDSKEADLKLRLLNQDAVPDEEKVRLEGEVVLYVRKLLKSKKKEQVFKLLKAVKDSMSPELKDLLSEELKT